MQLATRLYTRTSRSHSSLISVIRVDRRHGGSTPTHTLDTDRGTDERTTKRLSSTTQSVIPPKTNLSLVRRSSAFSIRGTSTSLRDEIEEEKRNNTTHLPQKTWSPWSNHFIRRIPQYLQGSSSFVFTAALPPHRIVPNQKNAETHIPNDAFGDLSTALNLERSARTYSTLQ